MDSQDQEIVGKAKKIIQQNLMQDFMNDVKEQASKINNTEAENQANYIKENSFPQRLFGGGKEIMFEINCIVFLENEKSEIIGTESVKQDRFHIPVEPGKDDKKYAKSVFNKFFQCLSNVLKDGVDENNE